MTRKIKRGGKVWINVFPDKSFTKKPAETRMGSGKGSPEGWVAVIKPGRVMFELAGVPEPLAKEGCGSPARSCRCAPRSSSGRLISLTRPSELRDLTRRRAGSAAQRTPAGAFQPALPVGDRRTREHRAPEAGQARDRADPHRSDRTAGEAKTEGDLRETWLTKRRPRKLKRLRAAAESRSGDPTAEAETPAAERETPAAEELRGRGRSRPRPRSLRRTSRSAEASRGARSCRARRRAEAEAAPAPQSQPKKKNKRLPRSAAPAEDAAEARGRDRAQADLPGGEAGARARPPPGAPRRRRVRRDGQDDRREGRVDPLPPEVQEGDPPLDEVPRARRAERAHVGDVVRIVETRPLSKTKTWRLAEIVEVAK